VKELNLTKGLVAIIDDDDFLRIGSLKWCASCADPKKAYAVKRNPNQHISSLLMMHREIFGYPLNGYEVDHINGNRLDNRKCNLRFVSRMENNGNARKASHGKSSKYKGVSYDKKRQKYEAYITKKDRKIHLGMFICEKDAAKAYNAEAITYFGEHAKLNEVT